MTTGEPEEVTLAREARSAGLVVTRLTPSAHDGWYDIQLWQPGGHLWAEARHEHGNTVRWHIKHYEEQA